MKKPIFARRAAAYLIDLLAVYLCAFCTIFASVMLYSIWQFGGDEKLVGALLDSPATKLFATSAHALVYFAYFTIAHWFFGCTAGKWLLGLKVAGPGGKELSLGRSLVRSLAYVVSGQLTLGIGFLLPYFRKDGRALHDIMLDTDVALEPRKNAEANPSEPAQAA